MTDQLRIGGTFRIGNRKPLYVESFYVTLNGRGDLDTLKIIGFDSTEKVIAYHKHHLYEEADPFRTIAEIDGIDYPLTTTLKFKSIPKVIESSL